MYGYIPAGLLLSVYTFEGYLREVMLVDSAPLQALMLLLVVLSVWWMFFTPGFVKPQWVRWVEAYPRQTRQAMAKAVAQGGQQGQGDQWWESHVSSPEALEAWVMTLTGGAQVAEEDG